MLLEFTVANYLSFKSEVTLSLVSTGLRSRDAELDEGARSIVDKDTSALHAAVLYGANASGKSNFVSALQTMADLVKDSAREGQVDDELPMLPYAFEVGMDGVPSMFEIVFRAKGAQYRYGFEASRTEVVREWLYRKRSREVLLFKRSRRRFTLRSDFKNEQTIARKTRPNALFLSVAAQLDNSEATMLLRWFRRIGTISGMSDVTSSFTAHCIHESTFDGQVLNLIRSFDVGITNIRVEERKLSAEEVPEGLPARVRSELLKQSVWDVEAGHALYDREGNNVGEMYLDFAALESQGTKKLFALAGPIVDTLRNGTVVVIDEFDARLHPMVSRELVKLFQSRDTNPHGAQLIIATHDTNLLQRELFRRDQVWFVEKSTKGESCLYSLASFKVRNDASFERDYFRGRYGAVPFLGGVHRLLESGVSETAL